jgi:hypothetical protein
MLEYFYTLKYTTNYPDAYVRIDIYARMYAIADKYEIKALKTIAAMNFQSEFPHAVEQAAWRSKLPQEIVSIADTVYTTTPDSDTTLRCTVATCVWEKVCFLSLSPNFKKMLAQISDLAFDLVMEASRLQEPQKCENMEKW